MIHFKNGVRLVERASELPDLRGANELFLDFETTSFDPTEAAFSPYKGHRACGACITADAKSGAWYVPVRHAQGNNIDEATYVRWIRDQISTCKSWVNHNVKFDAHFGAVDGAVFNGKLVDTMTLAKLINSDWLYKGGYGLKNLSKDWLEEDIGKFDDKVKDYLRGVKLPRGKKAQDYGLVPIDIMAEYGGQDVITNRKLWRYLCRRLPEDMKGVWNTEILLTPVLFDMEAEGMHVDVAELQATELKTLVKMVALEESLHDDVGFAINPSSSVDCFELLCNHYGLPVLMYNDDGNPSFDKNALKRYLTHPDVTSIEQRVKVIDKLRAYRKLGTLMGFFLKPYQEHQVDGILHPAYNQAVRSGRMSCKRPNAQQLSKAAKKLIHPPEGQSFLCCDYRQVEFRLIVHYIQDQACIESYAEDPETDFHNWVAEMCGIPRRPAKNVNFAIGYGAGKKKVTTMLAGNMELMENLKGKNFQRACEKRAEEVYWKYHETLPGLRQMTRAAERKITSRGYVRNAYGRRAHLSERAAYVAFNRLIQGCAADIIKERTVALAPRYNDDVKELGLKLTWSVHDETGLVGPTEVVTRPDVITKIALLLEDTDFKFRVPIRTSAGISQANWCEASNTEVDIIR